MGTIPVALDGVAVGDAGRLRHRRVRALFILGASAGSFPPPIASAPLLSDRDRERLNELDIAVQPAADRLGYRSVEAAFAALTLPTERLAISWVSASASQSSGYLVERIATMLGASVSGSAGNRRLLCAEKPALELALRAAAGNTSERFASAALRYFEQRGDFCDVIESARAAANGERGNLSEHSVELLYGEKITLTASRINQFSGCPFSHFMQYGLRAKPRGVAELDALESGNLLHYVLEKTVRKASENGLLDGRIGEYEKAAARQLSEQFIDEYLQDELGGLDDKGARNGHIFNVLRRTAASVVDDVMDEFAESDFRPSDFELGFGRDGRMPAVDITSKSQLVGKVDRVDLWRDDRLYMRVIDYKSGRAAFNLSDVYHGTRMQLLVYLFALERGGDQLYGEPLTGAGVLYHPARDVVLSAERGTGDEEAASLRDKSLRRGGLLLDNPDVLNAMEHRESSRFLQVYYNKDGSLSATSAVASPRQFELLSRHVERKLRTLSDEILRGEMSASPTVSHGRQQCDVCDFRDACRYDDTGGNDSSRYLFNVGKRDFWNRLEGEQT